MHDFLLANLGARGSWLHCTSRELTTEKPTLRRPRRRTDGAWALAPISRTFCTVGHLHAGERFKQPGTVRLFS